MLSTCAGSIAFPIEEKMQQNNRILALFTLILSFLSIFNYFAQFSRVMKPEGEVAKELEEILAKRQKKGKVEDDKPLEEKSILHGKQKESFDCI